MLCYAIARQYSAGIHNCRGGNVIGSLTLISSSVHDNIATSVRRPPASP